jgi:hypothetical protein
MRHRQREPHGNCRIDSISASLQNLDPNFGGMRFPRHHHGMSCVHRLPRK